MKTMRDSITVADLNLMVENGDPVPDCFGGYDDGIYANAAAIAQAFPGVPVLKFTVFAADNEGDCLDIEKGDATPQEAPAWTVKRRQAGHTWVTNYCSEADYAAVVEAYKDQDVPCPWLILAGYPGSVGEGVVYPWPYVIGHQFADRGPYDESVLLDTYPLFPQAPPTPPTTEDDMSPTPVFSAKPGQLDVVSVGGNRLWHKWDAGPGWKNEDVGAVSVAGAEAVFPNQTPQVSVIAGHFYITVQDSGGAPWVFDQDLSKGTWGVSKLP